jgi:hypothetical protein
MFEGVPVTGLLGLAGAILAAVASVIGVRRKDADWREVVGGLKEAYEAQIQALRAGYELRIASLELEIDRLKRRLRRRPA